MSGRRHSIGILILSFSVVAAATGTEERANYQERESAGNEKAWREAQPPVVTYDTYHARARAMAADLLPSPATITEVYGKSEALEDLWSLAAEIQALYDLRSATVLDSDTPSAIEVHSNRSIALASNVLDLINGGTGAPIAAPVMIPEGNFQERVQQLMGLFRQLIDPSVRLIAEDVLDLDRLDEVRTGYARMEVLILVLAESELLPPPTPVAY